MEKTQSELVCACCQDVKECALPCIIIGIVDKLAQHEPPELERRLTELQSQINRLSLSLHLWQERQDRLLEQRLSDWNSVEARAQKDASARMRELQETIEQEWNELRQSRQDPREYLRELGDTLGQKLTDLTGELHSVVTELRATGAIRSPALQQPAASWPIEDVVRLHNQLRDAGEGNSNGHADHGLAPRPLVLPEAPAGIAERLETLERAVSASQADDTRVSSVGPVWRAAIVGLAIAIVAAGVLVYRLQHQVNDATVRVSQAEQQAQVATKAATEQIAAAREEASHQIAQAREAAEKAQTISDVLAAPDLVRYNLVGGDGTSSFNAQALWSRSRGLVFSESRLPPLPSDSTYQIWLLSAGEPVSVGTFLPDSTGRYSMATTTVPRVQLPVAGVLVTLERAGGNKAPTGRVVLTRPQPPPAAAPSLP